MVTIERVAKSSKGCWTCKGRKIGCDKTLPSCSNCLRTRRFCQGYGLKLAWPEDGDGRRPSSTTFSETANHFLLSLSDSGYGESYYFINTSNEDLQEVKRPLTLLTTSGWHLQSPASTAGLFSSLKFGYETVLHSQESSLLSYYTNVLSRMVTTIDDAHNGFRMTLLPVALSEVNHATSALKQAVLALSAYHSLGHTAAIKYKLAAIRHLSLSLHEGEDATVPQFAASMMLCIGDVFDSADGSWPKHLAAAKTLSNRLVDTGEQGKDLLFLQTLLEYHVVLKGFSSCNDTAIEPVPTINPEKRVPAENKTDIVIIGALGCSRELMNLIALITRLLRSLPLPVQLRTLPLLIQTRLENLIQTPLLVPDSESGQLNISRIIQTAELYRLASLIYLHTTLIPLSRSSPCLHAIVSRSLELLESFDVCTSPWPLFVTALEVNNDADRLRILRVLEVMQKVRRIGNIDVLQRVVEAVWKRMDLRSDYGVHESERFDWRELFDMRGRLPSFI